jgi:phytepsin
VVEKENRKVSSPGNDLSCAFCEMAVIWIQNQLREKGTKDQVLKYVNEVTFSKTTDTNRRRNQL